MPVLKDEDIPCPVSFAPAVLTENYFIDKIFPSNEVHLIGGPSGAGKTGMIFKMLRDWKRGEDVFGYRSFPKEYVYVACDRSSNNLYKTLNRAEANDIPIISAIEIPFKHEGSMQYKKFIPYIIKHHPEARVIFIDGLATLFGEEEALNSYGKVSRFLIFMVQQALKYDVTFFGIVHTAKVKENEKYTNPRQKILGTVAWSAFSETIMVIEPIDSKKEDSKRLIYMLPRNEKEKYTTYKLNERGILVPVDENEYKDVGGWNTALEYINLHPKFARGEFEEYLKTKEIGRTKAGELLTHALEIGKIEKSTEYGKYIKNVLYGGNELKIAAPIGE